MCVYSHFYHSISFTIRLFVTAFIVFVVILFIILFFFVFVVVLSFLTLPLSCLVTFGLFRVLPISYLILWHIIIHVCLVSSLKHVCVCMLYVCIFKNWFLQNNNNHNSIKGKSFNMYAYAFVCITQEKNMKIVSTESEFFILNVALEDGNNRL